MNVSGDDNQSNACINAIKGDVDYRFEVSQREFAQIPGSPIVYWLSEDVLSLFLIKSLSSKAVCKHGMSTGNNESMLRLWSEVSYKRVYLYCKTREEAYHANGWVPYNKGGEYRKWSAIEYLFCGMIPWARNGC